MQRCQGQDGDVPLCPFSRRGVSNGLLDWVSANTAYDYAFSLPLDALPVYQNGRGACRGFANPAVALMQAADIPAWSKVGWGFQAGWNVGRRGGRHTWIETYYPDARWVVSDPHGMGDFVDRCHLFGEVSECGTAGTTVGVTSGACRLRASLSLDNPILR